MTSIVENSRIKKMELFKNKCIAKCFNLNTHLIIISYYSILLLCSESLSAIYFSFYGVFV